MAGFNKLHYYRRIFRAYLFPGTSQLSFWHDAAEPNPHAQVNSLGEYYMTFARKAEYSGPSDADGIPLLNYYGNIGLQYNPIAIAQWGLGNFNLYRRTGGREPVASSFWRAIGCATIFSRILTAFRCGTTTSIGSIGRRSKRPGTQAWRRVRAYRCWFAHTLRPAIRTT